MQKFEVILRRFAVKIETVIKVILKMMQINKVLAAFMLIGLAQGRQILKQESEHP